MRQFSDQHIAALAVMVLGAGISVSAARRHPGRWLVPFARALALLILAGWAGEYVADAVLGIWTVRYGLPLQLTDAVSAVAVLALWTRAATLIELAYFFTYHIGAVVAASFLVFGCRLYPGPRAVWRVYAATLGFAVVAVVGDLITGGNYMYLREKPAHSSLLSLMSPWPWYILETAVLGLILLLSVAGLTLAVRTLLRDTKRGANM